MHLADGSSPKFMQKIIFLAQFSLDASLFCEFLFLECTPVSFLINDIHYFTMKKVKDFLKKLKHTPYTRNDFSELNYMVIRVFRVIQEESALLWEMIV